MKHSKWLLKLILVILVINLTFFLAWYVFNIKECIKSKIEVTLSKELHGSFKIKDLSINERLVIASDVVFDSDDSLLSFNIEQIQVRYNLLKFLLSGFKLKKTNAYIAVFKPIVSLSYNYKDIEKKESQKIPDLRDYFRSLEIKNGILHIKIAYIFENLPVGSLSFIESFNNINCTINNKEYSNVRLTAKASQQGLVKANLRIENGQVSLMHIDMENYRPKSMKLAEIEHISSIITMQFDYIKSSVNPVFNTAIHAKLWDTSFEYAKNKVRIPYLSLDGDLHDLIAEVRNAKYKNNIISIKSRIKDVFSTPSFDSLVDVIAFDLSEIDEDISGIAEGNASISGTYHDFVAKSIVFIPEVSYQNETFTGIVVESVLADNKLTFNVHDIKWRQHVVNTQGILDFVAKKLDVDLKTNALNQHQYTQVTSDLHATLDFSQKNMSLEFLINNLALKNRDLVLDGFHGRCSIIKSSSSDNSLITNLDLMNNNGVLITIKGNLDSLTFESDISLNNTSLIECLPSIKKLELNSAVSGFVNVKYQNFKISGHNQFDFNIKHPTTISNKIKTSFDFNLSDLSGNLAYSSISDYSKDTPIDVNFNLKFENNFLELTNLEIDNTIKAKAWINMTDLTEYGLSIVANNFKTTKLWDLLNKDSSEIPFNADIECNLDYNFKKDSKVMGDVTITELTIPDLKSLNIPLSFSGNLNDIYLHGAIESKGSSNVFFSGSLVHNKDFKDVCFSGNAVVSNLNINDYFSDSNVTGSISGNTDWLLKTKKGLFDYDLSAKITGDNINLFGFVADSLIIDVNQSKDMLEINKLSLISDRLLKLNCTGALDYNVITNSFTQGSNNVNVKIEGDVLRWIRRFAPDIDSARSRFKLQTDFKVSEDGMLFDNGFITLSKGQIKVKNQEDAVNHINLEGKIIKNELILDKASCQFGQGKIFIRNIIDTGDDNFFIGPLNLGYLFVRTDDDGIQLSIPEYMPENTYATAVLKGQNSKEATIKGPFDDMEIKAEVVVSNGNAVFPPNTKNLLQLVNMFFVRSKHIETLPLPFTLDLMIRLKDNINYVTYPANLVILPNSYLRLTYDGTDWSADEAEFISEKGTLDFYGTIFDVEFVKLDINSQRDILAVNGTFFKKARDGTLVTLEVSTNPKKSGDVINQLEFKLVSDNPQDRSTPQILSRLRYGRNIDEISPEQRLNLLQDEAMQLISTSVSTTYISQFLSPIESKIRRFLRLDSFTISTGFVQNLFVEFSNEETERLPFSDTSNLNADIMQFSSAVLLNNFSVSMGKYLGRKFFIDYQIQLQETTDLAQKTKLDLYHYSSLQLNLPWQLRLRYTFNIKPIREANSHEVMLQRSFRF